MAATVRVRARLTFKRDGTAGVDQLRTIWTLWRRANGPRRLQLVLLAGLALFASVRVVRDFDADALTIVILSGLLFWVMAVDQRRRDEIGDKLDYLLTLQRYGPLSDDDREVIAVLRASAPVPLPRSGRRFRLRR